MNVPDKKLLKAGKKSKGHKKDDDYRVLQRRKVVAQMYVEGKTQFEIATTTGVTQQMIALDLKVIRDAWLATAIMDWDDVKAKELAKLDTVEERMWEAYHRSYGVEKIKTVNVKRELKESRFENTGRRSDEEVDESEAEPEDDRTDITGPKFLDERGELVVVARTTDVRTKALPGNPAYMTVILDCIKLRCKILGFLDDKNGGNNTNIQIGQINWDMIVNSKNEPDPIESRINALVVEHNTEQSAKALSPITPVQD